MKRIIINNDPWQVRAAVIEDKKLIDINFQVSGDVSLERAFFKGKIQRILPGIQTAFVDIGNKKAGFLHITEVDRSYAYARLVEGQGEELAEETTTNLPKNGEHEIGNIFKEGQEVLVQVIKEPVNEKGAKLSTCFALPGKFCVLLANIPHIGVSRKIEKKEERSRLKELVSPILANDMGVIVRTTAEGRSEMDIKRDLDFLVFTWHEIQARFQKAAVGEQIFQDLSLELRMIREHLDENTEEVYCDNQDDFNSVTKFLRRFMPEQENKIKLYQGKGSIFEHFGIENQIEELLQRKVHLKSGGSLIIESTEAMTVIDVNTGKFVGETKHEDTVFKTNMEAAEEVVNQLRLRNIGGIIVIDFIDMSQFSNRNKLYRSLEKLLKEKDKLRAVALRVSEFGIVQMTRKRTGKTIAQQMMSCCKACGANGFVRSDRTLSLEVLRELKKIFATTPIRKAEVFVSENVFNYLSSDLQASLLELEQMSKSKIVLVLSDKHKLAQFTVKRSV